MKEAFSKEQQADLRSSLQRYFAENFDHELNDLQAALLLEYAMTEIVPFAYNKGVADAQAYFAARTEDLSGVCFQETLTYWASKNNASQTVRRKTD